MKRLLTLTAVIEGATGLALIAMPAIFVRLLLGTPLQTYSAVVLGRVAGAALFALGVACWLARKGGARTLVSAMFVYNLCTAVILGVAGFWSEPVGIALWPAVVIHAVMTIWCVACLAAQAPIYDDDDQPTS